MGALVSELLDWALEENAEPVQRAEVQRVEVQTVEPVQRSVQRAKVEEGVDNKTVLRIVLFGKTGSGKSSTGNTILGREGFRVVYGQASGTVYCRQEYVKINGRNIKIIDTPGVCDSHRDPNEVLFEVSRCLCFASPGPHVLLFVINAASRFTQEEYDAYCILRTLFAEHLNKYIILVFTHCEALDNDLEALKKIHADHGQKIDEAKKEGRNMPDLRVIRRDVSNRMVIISNTADTYTKDRQILELLDQIQQLTQNDNHIDHFQDDLVEQATRQVEALLDKIRQQNPGMNQAQAWAELQRQLQEAERKKSNKRAAVAAVASGLAGVTVAAVGTVATGGALGIGLAAGSGGALISKAKDGRCSVM